MSSRGCRDLEESTDAGYSALAHSGLLEAGSAGEWKA